MSTASPFSHAGILGMGGNLYTGQAFGAQPQPLTGANLPAQARSGMTIGDAQRRRTGLIPMAAGSRHTVVLKTPDGEQSVPRDKLAALKTNLRKAQRAEQDAMAAAIDDPSEANAKAYLVVQGKAAAALSVWSTATARGTRPTQVHLLTAQDPSAVPEAFGDEEHLPRFICTHDGCKGQRWDQEADMRRSHPSPSQMHGLGVAHVFGLYSDAPMDPMDPEGGTVGLIAPIGADGLTAAAVAHAYLSGVEIPHGDGERAPQEIRRPGKHNEENEA